MTFSLPRHLMALLVAVTLLPATVAQAAEPAAGPDPALLAKTVDRAIEYLRTRGQSPDGAFSPQAGPAVTALVTTATLRHGRGVEDPLVARALEYLQGFVQEDGGIYAPTSGHRNYETAIALMCFAEANADGRYDETIAAADRYLKGLQWDEAEDAPPADVRYGGAGYGSHKRPDLSNTGFLIEALKAAGNGPDDPAMQKALTFVSRCQNMESKFNTTPFAALVEDGGFYYTVAAGGESQAGKNPDGGLRSYGSMTYVGLKSMIYAGVGPEDPRVKAAVDWVRAHYDLDSNPGMGASGLFYYYQTMAKALEAIGLDTLVDGDGREHDWRRELTEELASRQQADGSWVNADSSRWLEGDPNLVTGYVLLALADCRPE